MFSKLRNLLSNPQNIETPNIREFTFEPLTPVDNLDKNDGYLRSLEYALKSDTITNVALSGPYGAGKSSIIASYEKIHRTHFLNISLATFGAKQSGSDDEKDLKKQIETGTLNQQNLTKQIETGILNQLVYGAKSGDLPHSRFKRIILPKHSLPKSIFALSWLLATYYLWSKREQLPELSLLKLPNFSKFSVYLEGLKNTAILEITYSNLPIILLIIFVFAGGVYLLTRLHQITPNLSLKSLSLTNVEMQETTAENPSVLSVHLDEILYFFEKSEHRIVVFEDLDRFDNQQIFDRLREINKLVNDGTSCKTKIKFIYAIKDSRFTEGDRTKFFDFIIPIIPIINTTNSREKFAGRLKNCGLDEGISDQFLRDVSLYINDLRMINNIVNEYEIYLNKLPTEGLNREKLLAIITYKNVYSDDFEALHNRSGILFKVCNQRHDFERQQLVEKQDKIEELQRQIESAVSENAVSVGELINVYLAQVIVEASKEPIYRQNGFICGPEFDHFDFEDLQEYSNFELLMQGSKIRYKKDQYSGVTSLGFSFEDIEQQVNPRITFLERKTNIERRSANRRKELETEIFELETQISNVRNQQLGTLISTSEDEFAKHFETEGKTVSAQRYELLKLMLREGYLDESYSDFTSIAHNHVMGKNDNTFLRSVRQLTTPDPALRLENPHEVCKGMRAHQFGQKYVLNFSLIEYLLSDECTDLTQRNAAIKFLANNLRESELILTGFYDWFDHTPRVLVEHLIEHWAAFSKQLKDSSKSLRHYKAIIQNLSPIVIVTKLNTHREITTFVEEFAGPLEATLGGATGHHELYKMLKVRFSNLTALTGNDSLVDFSIAQNMYTLTDANVSFVLSRAPEIEMEHINTANYGAVLATKDSPLRTYVEANLAEYVRNVALSLPNNTQEDKEHIKQLLKSEKLHLKLKERLVEKQLHVFVDFSGIPEELYSFMLVNKKVSVNWETISAFQCSEHFDEEVLTQILDKNENTIALKSLHVWDNQLDDDAANKLSGFIIANEELSDASYAALMPSINRRYADFPASISEAKMQILIANGIVKLSDKTFSKVESHDAMMIAIIERNEDTFTAPPIRFQPSNAVLEELLMRDLKPSTKLYILDLFELDDYEIEPKTYAHIGDLIIEFEYDMENLDPEIIEGAIKHARDGETAVSLLLKVLDQWSQSDLEAIIQYLPEPYSNMEYEARIPYGENNQKLVKGLREKGLLHSSRKVSEEILVRGKKHSNQ